MSDENILLLEHKKWKKYKTESSQGRNKFSFFLDFCREYRLIHPVRSMILWMREYSRDPSWEEYFGYSGSLFEKQLPAHWEQNDFFPFFG